MAQKDGTALDAGATPTMFASWELASSRTVCESLESRCGMCEYLKRMSPQGAPTDDIRLWSGLAHSVVEHTGPRPFGMDGSVYLWLHERSVTQLLDMCDELDAKFSDLMLENAKLRNLVETMRVDMCEMLDIMNRSSDTRAYCLYYRECLGAAEDIMRELGIEVE